MVAPVAANAVDLNMAAVNQYTSSEQVSSITQLSDVKPTDWAYQALNNLVERYGCVAGYPNGTFVGGQSMTRYEAAALLNACLDRVTEVTDELNRLANEFAKELQVIRGRVTKLETQVGQLQATQFSTTTKLKGEATFVLGGVDNARLANGTNVGNTAFNYDVRLNFDTSFTGKDLLRTRLRTGNFSSQPFGSSSSLFKLDKAESYANAVQLDRLYYSFPALAKGVTLTAGALVRNTEMAWIPTAYKSNILDVFAVGGTGGVYNKATGEGVGLQWKQPVAKGQPGFVFNANYVVNGSAVNSSNTTCTAGCKNGTSGSDSTYGVFNSDSGINILTQLGYKATQWGAAVGYRYGTTQSGVRDGNGVAGSALGLGQYSNAVALNAYWQPKTTGAIPSVSIGYGYNFVNGNSTSTGATAQKQAQSSRSWMVGFQWDDAFRKSNAAGIAFGQPANSAGASGSNPWLVEWFYKVQVSDNISVTPALFYASGSSNSTTNAAGQPTFSGLGGVIQTTFKF
ncbi:MAG: porin [Proteobacteria bacterium]|nr:porin [Pseudomonadota bacterium]